MRARREAGFRKKKPQHSGKRNPRIGHANQGLFPGSKWPVNDDGGGRALFGAGEIVLVLGEGEIARLGAVSGSEPFEHQSWVAGELAGQVFCDLSGGEWHRFWQASAAAGRARQSSARRPTLTSPARRGLTRPTHFHWPVPVHSIFQVDLT